MHNFDELIIDRNEYTKQEISSLLKIEDSTVLSNLFAVADTLRSKYIGDGVTLSNLIQFSNYCSKNCIYCALRRSNLKIERYRFNNEKIIELAKESEKKGFRSITFEAGDDNFLSIDVLVKLINEIKKKTSLSITLSVGEKTENEYEQLKAAGCDKYILKHRTSDPILYRQLHPDFKYSTRIKLLKILKNIGFKVQSGITVGLPGQTFESIANDIILFKELDVDIIQISPYIPHPDTPLSRKFDQIGGYFAPAVGYFEVEDLIYKIIAITRLVNKKSNIMVSQVSDPNIDNFNLFKKSIKYGADSILISIFESEFYKCLNASARLSPNRDTQSLFKDLKTEIKILHRELN